MTEAQWLHGWYYNRMYDVVRKRATTRQVRLYMAACCRLKEIEFFDPRIPRALEAAERCADDPQFEAVANAVWIELVTSPRPRLLKNGLEGELAQAITGAWQLLDQWWGDGHYRNPGQAIVHAAYLCLRSRPRDVFTGGDGNAAEYCARAIDRAGSLLSGANPEEVEQDGQEIETEIRSAIAHLLRDIFGNPFRPCPAGPAWLLWNGGALQRMGRSIYDARTFDRLPILADALEEAGCTDGNILDHCRGSGPHVRGCWVIDLILGKQ